MQIVTECEKTLMFEVTWRDVYGQIRTDFAEMNNSEPRYTAKDWKKAAEEIIRTINGEKLAGIMKTVQIKHNDIYIAVV